MLYIINLFLAISVAAGLVILFNKRVNRVVTQRKVNRLGSKKALLWVLALGDVLWLAGAMAFGNAITLACIIAVAAIEAASTARAWKTVS